MSLRHAAVPGSAAYIVYDDAETVPSWQARRLERALEYLFPSGCGSDVTVDLAWSEDDAAWSVRRALVGSGAQAQDTTTTLCASLLAAGLPLSGP